ncbi:MFS transporter [Streptomyces sp. B6B3]|uniref:MFS transporter n=1 Tax=Streptomyces sp. B6B3 TaxID=3153570 RepID=UPI00325D1E96
MKRTPEMADTTDPTTGGSRRLALAVLSLALALDVSSLGIVNPALPEIGDRLGMDSQGLQWIVSSYAVAFAALLLFGGRAADVFGRRRVFAAGVAVFTLGSLLAALATEPAFLIAARAGQGVGAALAGPASLALITHLYPEGEERNRAFGVYASVGAVSFTAGLLLGGVLTDAFGWRSVFLFTFVLGVITLLPVGRVLPESAGVARSLDLPGLLLATSGLVLCVYGVTELSSAGSATAPLLALGVAVLLLAGFLVRERVAADALLPLAMLRSAPVRDGMLTAVAFFTAMTSVLFYAPIYMQEILGYSPLQSGLAGLPMGAVVVLSAGLGGKLLSRTGPLRLMIAGLLVVALGVAWWVRTPLDGVYWIDILPGVLVMGLGQGLTYVSMTASSLTGVPDEQHGVAGGLNVTAQQLGAGVGLAVAATIAVAFTPSETPQDVLAGQHSAYLTGVAVAVAGALLLALRLTGPRWAGRRRRAVPDATTAMEIGTARTQQADAAEEQGRGR